MKWYVYILQSLKSKHYYIGSTNDRERRLKEHNTGINKSTKNKGPWIIIYTEEFITRIKARRREIEIKSYKGGNAFKKIIQR
jgi:putative endonuclease